MLEAIFGGLMSFAVRVGARIIEAVVDVFRDEVGSTLGRSFRPTINSSATKLREIAEEVSEREKSLLRRENQADRSALEDLRKQQASTLSEYNHAQQGAAASELSKDPDQFSVSSLDAGNENRLLYHVGLVTLKKNCLACAMPMRLQHRTVPSPTFSDFFWQCTGFYRSEAQCRRTEPFRPSDLSLVHKSDIPELSISTSDLDTIASHVEEGTEKRVAQHLGEMDVDVLCPVHSAPMVLRQKHGPDDMPLLDKFHLRCPQHLCGQITKLKSYPQLAAFLRRKDGVGIIH